VLYGDPEPAAADLAAAAGRLREAIAAEGNPRLLALRDAAAARGVPFLSDDDDASVGLGAGSRTWPVDALPAVGEVDWRAVHAVPVALITGTNGKTTTARLAARIAAEAGQVAGYTSTEWIGVGAEIVARGDYSGPSGARTVLRDRRVEVALLETARGGLLRRGLGVAAADVAALTTLAEDHLGDFGSGTLAELGEIKWVVTRAVGPSGRLVLSADDARLVALATQARSPIVWCSQSPDDHPWLAAHLADGGEAVLCEGGRLQWCHGDTKWDLVAVDDVPITLGGAARHHVANALSAAGLCLALGLPVAAVVAGLRAMRPEDNPGRSNLRVVGGVRVLVDYAHNPQAMAALAALVRALPARRRVLCFGQAGDRTDAQLAALTAHAWTMGLSRVHIAELAEYRRGRPEGEVVARLRAGLEATGAEPGQIAVYATEMAAHQAALAWAGEDDLVVQIALADDRLKRG
jgi:UDP-N-acetylmuramyl tripeptide synthase